MLFNQKIQKNNELNRNDQNQERNPKFKRKY